MGQFCQRNIYWRRLKIKFSHEPRTTFQISWRAESESGYVWTSKFDLNTTCGGENFWIRKEKVQVQIQKYPDTCERDLKKAPLSLQRTGTREALGKMLKFTIASSQERMVSDFLVSVADIASLSRYFNAIFFIEMLCLQVAEKVTIFFISLSSVELWAS